MYGNVYVKATPKKIGFRPKEMRLNILWNQTFEVYCQERYGIINDDGRFFLLGQHNFWCMTWILKNYHEYPRRIGLLPSGFV
jgi:hypothetical protein